MSWFKDITKEFEHMNVAGSGKHKQSGDGTFNATTLWIK